MSGAPNIPRRYRMMDLGYAYLEGKEEGRKGAKAPFGEHRNYCAAEWKAYNEGFRDGEREKAEGAV